MRYGCSATSRFTPRDRLEKVEELTLGANEFRKNCINFMMNEGSITLEDIRKQVEATLSAIQAGR